VQLQCEEFAFDRRRAAVPPALCSVRATADTVIASWDDCSHFHLMSVRTAWYQPLMSVRTAWYQPSRPTVPNSRSTSSLWPPRCCCAAVNWFRSLDDKGAAGSLVTKCHVMCPTHMIYARRRVCLWRQRLLHFLLG
jgi:hypothetical protein